MKRLFSHQNKEKLKQLLKDFNVVRETDLYILQIWRFSFALTLSA